MATVTGTKRLLDISSDNITTAVSLEAEGTLLDVNGTSGTSGQLLSSTGTGVDWVSNNSGSWDGILSGSAQITGSLGVTGSIKSLTNEGFNTWEIGASGIRNSDTDESWGLILNPEEGLVFTDATFDSTNRSVYSSGDVRIRGLYDQENSTTGAVATIKNTNINGSGLDIWAANGGGGTNTILRLGTSSETVKMVVVESGNVGIGTTSPTQKLDVNGTIAVEGEIVISSSTGFLDIGQHLATTVSKGLKFYSDETLAMTIDTNTNVGIGTSTPTEKLQIGLGTGTGSDGIFIKGTFAGGTAYGASKNPFISLGTSTDAGYTSTIYLGSSATSTGQESKIEFNRSNNALSIYYKGQGTYREHVRFGDPGNSTPKSIFFGNVGIGVTSPSAALDVFATGKAAKFVSSGNIGLEVQGGGNSQNIAIFKNAGGYSEVVIDTAGKVGIGVTSPSSELEVAGNILANNINATNNINSTVNIGSTVSSTLGYGYPNTAAGTLIVGGYTNAGYNYQPGVISLINQNPNIGAGTDLGVLQFAGKSNATSAFVSSNIKAFTATAAGSGNSGGGIISISTSTGVAGASPTERFRINQTGNIGIGTTSPINKLQVNYTPIGIGSLTATSGTASTNWNRNAGLMITGASVSNALALGTSGTANDYKAWIQVGHPDTAANSLGILALNPLGGNVGIGNTSPSHKLDVNGTARVNGVLTIPGVIGHDGDFGTSIGFPSNDTIALSTNGSTKLEIDALGTTAITGNLRVGTDIFNALNINSGLTGTTYTTNANGLNSQPDISFNTGLNTRLKINGINGNTGIGTTSPSTKLHVVDSSTPQVRIGNDTFNYLNISVNGSGDSTIAPTGNGIIGPDLILSTGAGLVQINGSADGNVGIGTSTPSEKLEVDGNVQADTLIATDLSDGYVPYNRNGTLGLQDSEIYQDGGQVGIGTTTLTQTLNVDGDVLADGYRLSAMQTAPASRTAAGTLGEIRITSNAIYVCYATNSWSKVTLDTSW